VHEPGADQGEAMRDEPGPAPGARPPLDAITGSPPAAVPEPGWSIEEPWPVRGVREHIQALTSQAPAARAARRQLAWFTLAAVGLVLVVALVVAVF
jgi:hypothetical protein